MEFNYPNADALVEQTEMGRYSTLSSSNDACTEVIPDWQGNIRPSFFRRHRFALVGFLTVGLIVGLSYLTSIVTKFVPNSSPLDLASQVSCDLTTAFERNGSAMENAFTINLRGTMLLPYLLGEILIFRQHQRTSLLRKLRYGWDY